MSRAPASPATAHTRSVLLADCDVFYVQLARMADPAGAGAAPLLIVGGTAESRGVVCSASYEVRAFGVRSGMPIARAVRLCPTAMCVPVPRRMCAQKSREIVRVLERFAPEVQPASPDEAYLELTSAMSTVYRGRSLEDIAHQIRRAVFDETRIRLSLGGGSNRLVAKLAVERAKPRPGSDGTGVFVVPPGDESAFVASVRLADIPGIGPKLQERLGRMGWRDVRDVLPCDEATLERCVGERLGRWLYAMIRGIDESAVERRTVAKSISRENTFPADRTADAALRRELLALTDVAVADLREAGYTTRTISVRVKDANFTIRRASRSVPEPLTTYQAIAPIATDLLARLRSTRRGPVRLIGVSLSQLEGTGAGAQLAFFDRESGGGEGETAKQRAVADAVDHLRAHLGRGAIGFGDAGLTRSPDR